MIFDHFSAALGAVPYSKEPTLGLEAGMSYGLAQTQVGHGI